MYMSATISLIERNGASPGKVTENIQAINWKAIDDVTTPFTYYTAVIPLATNSYMKYNYIRFSGTFTRLGNVRITHVSGSLPNGIKLMTSPSITDDSHKLSYAKPDKNKHNNNLTTYDFSGVGAYVNLIVGYQGTASDPAYAIGKAVARASNGSDLYTNYFLSQVQVAASATIGDMGPIVLEISYDEI